MTYVLDTLAVISYFSEVFNQPNLLSKRCASIIHRVLHDDSRILLIIPSTVFIEIWNKWCRCDELREKIRYEVLEVCRLLPNVEIRPIDQEVIEKFISISSSIPLERHDKLIISTALVMECPLITTDSKIIEFLKNSPQKVCICC